MLIYNITGGQIRNDLAGHGYFHASRSNDKGPYQHKGIDITCQVGQECWSPITGIIKRKVRVYSDTALYTGYEIANNDLCLKVLYVNIPEDLIGKKVMQGDTLGLAQNINKRYPKCLPHVHIEIVWINPLLLM